MVDASGTERQGDRPVLALVDTSPVLLLPSILACCERSPECTLRVTLTGPVQSDAAMERLVSVLARHDIPATIQPRADTLEATVSGWLEHLDANAPAPVLDVSSASGGTATRAVLALQRAVGRAATLCWFNEANNEVHFSTGGIPEAQVIDIGSRRSVRSAITPDDFMAIFGLDRAHDDPYCGVGREHLLPPARKLLSIALDNPGEYVEFRKTLGAARNGLDAVARADLIPSVLYPLLEELTGIDGWIRREGEHLVFRGTRNRLALFFLSGGWLEVVVTEAIRRALPDHEVRANCGAMWGQKRRAEAEMDVAFVYKNALYLVSCKNEHVTERFFPHLDRFRALTAEFGESRTRPVLLSTAELEPRHVRRCDAYEIGQISGRTLLELIERSLTEEPEALLNGLVTVSRGAPRAGIV